MRSFICGLAIFVSLFLFGSLAIADETQPGDFGHRHHDLHTAGVIASLMKKTKSQCCEGETSGECRATILKYKANGVVEALLNRKWCPLSTTVHYDIPLIEGVDAVVCASKLIDKKTGCPSTYCAAAMVGG